MENRQIKEYDQVFALRELTMPDDSMNSNKVEQIYSSIKMVPMNKASSQDAAFQIDQNLAMYVYNFTWAGLNYRLWTSQSSKTRVRPYFAFLSQNLNMVLRTGYEIAGNSAGPHVSLDKITQESHLHIHTLISKKGHWSGYWMNHKYGGPLLKYTDELYFGYLHNLEIRPRTFLTLKTKGNWTKGLSSVSTKIALSQHSGSLHGMTVRLLVVPETL
jgi:hypothetical protein